MNKYYKDPKHDCPPPFVPCFVGGTNVLTRKGLVPVESVKVGTKVLTRDNGFKEVTWVGSALSKGVYRVSGVPFSPNHRVLAFNGEEVFVTAKKYQGAVFEDVESLYVHFMLDSHEVVMVDGLWAETFYPGKYVMDNMDQEHAAEISALFPDYAKWELARKEVRK